MGRVFTPAEQRQIRDSHDSDRTLWTLWAGKETAYKTMRRRFPAITSAPRRYEVTVGSFGPSLPESGTVNTPCGPVSIRFSSTDNYVHCVGAATQEDIDTIIWDIEEIPQTQLARNGESDFVRNMARRNLSTWLGNEFDTIAIVRPKDDYGLAPPVVRIEERWIPVLLSMSHDGRFAACALTIPSPPEKNH